MKTSVIICAAGKGERAGFERNKLLMPLNGQPVIFCTAEKFFKIADEIIIAAAEDETEEISSICSPFNPVICRGGKDRTESVYNALKFATGDLVLIHDGARPFIEREDVISCLDCAEKFGSAVCARPCTDTVCKVLNGEIVSVPDRRELYSLQTPQCFLTEDIKKAYELAICDGCSYTDDSAVYLKYIGKPHVFICGQGNKKLTFKEDFVNAAEFKIDGTARVGFGSDVHALTGGDSITLCGVKISCPYSLVAHSDGDVPIHAVMDALLSAAGLKDIGNHFPDDDDKFKNADSIELLKNVVKLLKERGYAPFNASVAIQAQTPKLSPFIDGMKEKLSLALGIDKDFIGISAGTGEGLGFVGNKLGIYSTAAVLIMRTDGVN